MWLGITADNGDIGASRSESIVVLIDHFYTLLTKSLMNREGRIWEVYSFWKTPGCASGDFYAMVKCKGDYPEKRSLI